MEVTATIEPTKTVKPTDIHQLITNQFIEDLEDDIIPWRSPITSVNYRALTLPYNCTTNNYYNGINVILLWSSTVKNKFQTDEWAGDYQWRQRNEQVRPDEKESKIIYYDSVEKEIDGELKKVSVPKTFKVYNRCQLKSYVPEKLKGRKSPELVERFNNIYQYVVNTGAVIEKHDDLPSYDQTSDKLLLPFHDKIRQEKKITEIESLYSGAIKELVHWSGAKHRLNRPYDTGISESGAAFESLISELGAAFLCAGLGIANTNGQTNIGGWIKILKENDRCIFSAASEAMKAVKYLNELQPK